MRGHLEETGQAADAAPRRVAGYAKTARSYFVASAASESQLNLADEHSSEEYRNCVDTHPAFIFIRLSFIQRLTVLCAAGIAAQATRRALSSRLSPG
jgi:hypothetical protein